MSIGGEQYDKAGNGLILMPEIDASTHSHQNQRCHSY